MPHHRAILPPTPNKVAAPSNTSRHFTPRTVREWGSAARAWAAAFFDYLSDSFRPILGVLLGASLVIAIVNVIVALGIVPDGETSAAGYYSRRFGRVCSPFCRL